MNVRIGMGQLLVEGGEPKRNLARAAEMIKTAAERGCHILLLPECLDLGWTHPTAKTRAEPIPGPFSDVLCAQAAASGLYVCAGLTERDGDRVYNAAVLIDPQGTIVLKYRKINELTVGHDFYAVGDRLGVVETPHGIIGVNICADNYFDALEIGHVLGRMGAQIILSPSAWTIGFTQTESDNPYGEKWTRPLTTLASLYGLVFVSATCVGYIVGGPYEGKKMVGCSLLVDPDGIVAKGRYNELSSELVVADVAVPQRKERGTEIGEMLRRKGYSPRGV